MRRDAVFECDMVAAKIAGIARGGFRYDATRWFRAGGELAYRTESGTVEAVPQVWLTFPHEVTLKCGCAREFGGSNERYFRVALEAGF